MVRHAVKMKMLHAVHGSARSDRPEDSASLDTIRSDAEAPSHQPTSRRFLTNERNDERN